MAVTRYASAELRLQNFCHTMNQHNNMTTYKPFSLALCTQPSLRAKVKANFTLYVTFYNYGKISLIKVQNSLSQKIVFFNFAAKIKALF